MKWTGHVSVRRALKSSLTVLLLSQLSLAQSTEKIKPTEDLVLRTANYVARVSKDAFWISIQRGNELVFETGRPGDPATSLEFTKDDKPQHVTRLTQIEKTGDALTLYYDTTHK